MIYNWESMHEQWIEMSMSTTICTKALHSIDDPEEHVGGVQQDGHGQLRRRGGRGGQWQVHLSSVLLGEEKHTLLDSGSVPIKVHSRSIKCTRKRHKIIQICFVPSNWLGAIHFLWEWLVKNFTNLRSSSVTRPNGLARSSSWSMILIQRFMTKHMVVMAKKVFIIFLVQMQKFWDGKGGKTIS